MITLYELFSLLALSALGGTVLAWVWMGVSRWRRTTKNAVGAEDSSSSPDRTNTEFSAEVVRVTSVTPHPNADRLDLCRFEMAGTGLAGYEVVTRRGDYQPGDLAAYISVDCILPLDHPEFAFLRSANSKRTTHRLRAARLRGVFSQGLLVPAPAGMVLGDSVAKHFGITYHTTFIDAARGESRPATKEHRQVMPIYGVASLKKSPDLFHEGEPVVVTEKIHGTNFRFGWVRRRVFGIPLGWRFTVGSHRVIKGEVGTGNHWYKEDVWTEAATRMGLAEKTRKYPGHIFYGELYGHTYSGKRIQDLTYSRRHTDGPALAIFDVLGPKGWLSLDERLDVCRDAKIDHVPILFPSFAWSPEMVDAAEGVSTLDGVTIREGIVVESQTGERRKAKFVSQGYLLREAA